MIKCRLERIRNETKWCSMQELELGMLWPLLSPCASPAWAAAMASVWHSGCSCGYRYVKLGSLCFGASHECMHRLMVGFWERVGNYVSRADK